MPYRKLIDIDLDELQRTLPALLQGVVGEDRRLTFDGLAFQLRNKWKDQGRTYLDERLKAIQADVDAL